MDAQLRNEFDTFRIPLVQGMVRSPTPSSFNGTVDQCYVNCFPQAVVSPTGEKDYCIVKRPGMEKVSLNLQSILGAGVSSNCVANIPITQ